MVSFCFYFFRFGPGPHYVEISVLLPHLDESQNNRTFIIEMAPLDYMPHAVHLFLEQVSHGLWNSAWFYVNGPHVMQAGPMALESDMEANPGIDERTMALRPFRKLKLETLAFPEYSEEYPHVRWTLGFTGRPGGPGTYSLNILPTRNLKLKNKCLVMRLTHAYAHTLLLSDYRRLLH